MILTLELILLIVYGVFCFALVKGAERTNKNMKEKKDKILNRQVDRSAGMCDFLATPI